MKIKQTIKHLIMISVLSLLVVGFNASTSFAVNECTPGEPYCCAGVKTSVITCGQTGGDEITQTGVWGILLLVINILTAGVGVAAVGGVIYASILYASAGDSSEQTKKAISIIINVAIGLVAYALMYVFLNFIIPGGKFPL